MVRKITLINKIPCKYELLETTKEYYNKFKDVETTLKKSNILQKNPNNEMPSRFFNL